ncbi:DNA ligase D-like 3'-phosphoesterase domain-containing protein [Chlamydiales bacterium STE3]|nr:DNA ligase D-like 3'-phosphoesterase domain-containing protein [Chlamydiales bacterium STE3]
MTLKRYIEKRIFSKTTGPKTMVSRKSFKHLHFSIQKHEARQLHYDLRLEFRGVLLSWAIPKGPSLDPKDKRLAIQVEDHPLDYRTFEGTIPAGNYGAGKVTLWDEGIYTIPETQDVKDAEKKIAADLQKGHLIVFFSGAKLKGEFHLIRMQGREKNAWLFIKHQDAFTTKEDILTLNEAVKKKH